MHSSIKSFLIISVAFLFGIKSYSQSIYEIYKSNWQDSLIIYSDSSFKIYHTSTDTVNIKVLHELTGKLTITKKYIRFTSFNESSERTADWSCHVLQRKRKKLIRPLHCSPTHQFLIFEKVNS